MGLIVSHKCDAEGKEKTILRRDTGQILDLKANIKLARINTFLFFFLLTAVPMFKFNHQSVSQFRVSGTPLRHIDMCISSSYIPQSSNNFLNIHKLKIKMY